MDTQNMKAMTQGGWKFRHGWRGLAVVAALVAGCNLVPPPQTDPTRFYVLIVPPAAAAADQPLVGKKLVVGLHGVEIPAYLKTKSLVVRVGTDELKFHEYARWGEALDQGIARVVREELSATPGIMQVVGLPGRDERDRDVAIQVLACEGNVDGTVRFSAAWEISSVGAGAEVVAHGTYTATGLHWDGRDDAQLVQRLSEAATGLSAELVAALAH
jgi:hypothetical protein